MKNQPIKGASRPPFQPPEELSAWPLVRFHDRERLLRHGEALLQVETTYLLDDTLTEVGGLARNPSVMDAYAGSF